MKLYILGNGFDLWHGLPTSYGHFHELARETLDEAESFFDIDLSKVESPWHDFENCLATFSWKSLYQTHDYTDVRSEGFTPSHAYCLQDELVERADELVEAICAQFNEWVEGIDVLVAPRRFKFDPSSRFITFNYTSTLQTVYEVADSNILHVHGRAGEGELVFGHGVQIVEEPEFDSETGESNRTIFSDAEASAKYPLYAFKKQVEAIIKKHRPHFTSLREIAEIVVFGHSLNDVDLPYFQEIANSATACRWIVYCFQESDWGHHTQQLIRCGVSRDGIITRSYND